MHNFDKCFNKKGINKEGIKQKQKKMKTGV